MIVLGDYNPIRAAHLYACQSARYSVSVFRCFGNLFPKRISTTSSRDIRQVRLI